MLSILPENDISELPPSISNTDINDPEEYDGNIIQIICADSSIKNIKKSKFVWMHLDSR